MSAASEALHAAADSLAVARGALEAAKPRAGTRVAGCVKEALEELDYVDEALAIVTKARTTQLGKSAGALWDWIADMEQSGEWDTRMRIEEMATRAVKQWEYERQMGQSHDMVTFDFPLHRPTTLGPPLNGPPPSVSASFDTYRILIPVACRSAAQAKYVIQRQLEEAFGL
jgi:hypothetical protein